MMNLPISVCGTAEATSRNFPCFGAPIWRIWVTLLNLRLNLRFNRLNNTIDLYLIQSLPTFLNVMMRFEEFWGFPASLWLRLVKWSLQVWRWLSGWLLKRTGKNNSCIIHRYYEAKQSGEQGKLLNKGKGFSFSHVFREINQVADRVAKLGFLKPGSFWNDDLELAALIRKNVLGWPYSRTSVAA